MNIKLIGWLCHEHIPPEITTGRQTLATGSDWDWSARLLVPGSQSVAYVGDHVAPTVVSSGTAALEPTMQFSIEIKYIILYIGKT